MTIRDGRCYLSLPPSVRGVGEGVSHSSPRFQKTPSWMSDDSSYGDYGSDAINSSYGEGTGNSLPDEEGEYSAEYPSDDDRSADGKNS